MEELKIIHKNILEPEFSDNKRLSVVISTGSLSCFISAEEHIELIAFRAYDSYDVLVQLIKSLLESYNVKHIHIYYDHHNFSLIPRKFFLYGDEKSYIRNVFQSSPNDVIFTDHIAEHQLVNVYSTDVLLDMALRQNFPGVKTEHTLTKLLKNIQASQKDSLICYFFDKSCYSVLIQDHKIQIARRFEFENEKDVLYNLNLLIHDYDFNGHVSLQGLIASESKIYKLLNAYIKDVDIYSRDVNLNTHAII